MKPKSLQVKFEKVCEIIEQYKLDGASKFVVKKVGFDQWEITVYFP